MLAGMGLDEQLFLAANQALSGPATTAASRAVTGLGNGLVLALLIIVPMLAFDRRRLRRHLVPLVLSVAVSGGLVNLMKIAVDRPRPGERFAGTAAVIHVPLGTPSDRSFPSGHTQTAFGAATYLGCLYPAAMPAFLAAATLVGLSRVALGVHYPADVLAGALIGAAFSLVTYRLARRFHRRREERRCRRVAEPTADRG
jgi:undecaprenyl-diphosphatase